MDDQKEEIRERFQVPEFLASLDGMNVLGKRKAIMDKINELNEEASRIKSKLKEVGARAWSQGVFEDPDWHRRTQDALRIKGRQVQALQHELRFPRLGRELPRTW